MPSVLHEVDPDGGLIAVLKEPNTQRVIPDIYLPPPKGSENPDFVLDSTEVLTNFDCSGYPSKEDQDDGSPLEIRYRVSSRHLMLASVTFKKMLSGPWKEASPGDQEPSSSEVSHSPCIHIREVSAIGWHADALLTVFKIIHSQCSEVPCAVSLKYLTNVALIANYYQCAGALSLAVQLWIKQGYGFKWFKESGLPYGTKLIMWLFIAWVFSQSPLPGNAAHQGLLFEASRSVTHESYGLSYIETYDLPISEILAPLEKKRLNGLRSLTSALSNMNGKVKRNELGCDNHRCTAMVIGSLELNLEEHPELTVEDGNYDGLSIKDVINAVQDEFGPSEDEMQDGMHLCTPKSLMKHIIKDVQREIRFSPDWPVRKGIML
ncbi:uncharacterized protein FIESC28_00445 [Fusarium coffeatum]|uniref:BTB domain-containing protein n=1 Tax=Fusarium coffeatum TaxID=231269 RepID=A0A366SBP1_9HYPO|nr:uncharacterized protein FIESC28_00445 [Fusarium coffeatum]RBR26744.1 hypothetical protein FIESC28_00445 [Fusarium coffeatum]